MEISSLGEFGLIDRLTKDLPVFNPSTVKGVGDDCAVLRNRETDILVTTDLLLEGFISTSRTYLSSTSATSRR